MSGEGESSMTLFMRGYRHAAAGLGVVPGGEAYRAGFQSGTADADRAEKAARERYGAEQPPA